MMNMVPDFVSEDMFSGAVETSGRKPGEQLESLRLEVYDEGPVLAHVHNEVVPAMGVTCNGARHEIYLSDPRKVEHSRCKTPVKTAR